MQHLWYEIACNRAACLAKQACYLFFSLFGLSPCLGAEAVNLLSEPLADPGHLHARQLLQVVKEQLCACALTHLLWQHLTHKVGHWVQDSVVPAAAMQHSMQQQ